MRLADRLLTIVVTATLTSAAWIVVGTMFVDLDGPGGTDAPVEEASQTAAGQQLAPPEAPASPASTAAADLHPGEIVPPTASEIRQLIVPVLNVRPNQLVDTFSHERESGQRLHEAIDITAPEGTSVVAAAPGTIERLFRSDVGGNTIYVRSDDRRTIYYYAHLAEYAPGLREGQKIRRGQRLGTVGSTGNVSPEEPHLHFSIMRTTPDAEWWEPATALNPFLLLGGNSQALSGPP